jgi:lipoprotein signal peptidase
VQAAGGTPLSGQVPAPAEGEPTAEPARPRRVGLLLGVAAFVIAADIITKAVAVAHIREYSRIHVLGSLLMLTLTRNGGAAFNIGGTSMTIVFTAIAAGVVFYILRASRNLRSIGWAITLGLLLGGATGNLLDRIFRAPAPFRGDVVDWIELPHWPVFNLADSAIVCAGFLVVLLALRGIRLDGSRAARDEGFHATDPQAADSPPTLSSSPSSPSPQPPPPSPQSPQPHTSEPDYPKPDYPESQSRAAQSP